MIKKNYPQFKIKIFLDFTDSCLYHNTGQNKTRRSGLVYIVDEITDFNKSRIAF